MENRTYLATILTVAAAQILLFVLIIKLLCTVFPPEITAEKCQRSLNKYENEYFLTASYLLSTGTDSTTAIRKGNYPLISPVSNEFGVIFDKCDCELIILKNSAVYYQLWSNLDYGRGILYCNNPNELGNEFIIELVPLSQSGWYFYIEE